jgi:hypothetical protein
MTKSGIRLAMFLLAAMFVYTILILIVSGGPGGKVLYESKQPSGIKYGSFDPYVLRVLEGPIEWSTYGWPRSSIIQVTRDGEYAYGHFINMDQIPSYVTDGGEIAVVWSQEGIEVSYHSGHRLLIPKSAFIGGR